MLDPRANAILPPAVARQAVPFGDGAELPTLPDHFIDGVPHRRVFAGLDIDGHRIYESVRLEIPAGAPSYLWREGA